MLIKKHIKRINYSSKESLKKQLLSIINYFNATMAKPHKWKYKYCKHKEGGDLIRGVINKIKYNEQL